MPPASDVSPPVFEGIPPAGLRFLAALARHNDRDWFQAHHATYRTQLREPMLALAAALNERLARFAAVYATPPRRAVTAINRDLRFARDRTQVYKSWLALAFRRPGAMLGNSASFYVSVSPREVRIRCGLPVPSPHAARGLRAHILEAHPALRVLLRRRGLQTVFGGVQGARYRRIPKDVPADHPATALCLYRSLFVETQLEVEVTRTRGLVNEIARRFRVATPLVQFIDAALLDTEE